MENQSSSPLITDPFARKPSVLLVDDEKEMLELLKCEFEEQGFECFVADSVAQAVQMLSSKEVDVILSDIRMPGQSGMDLYQMVQTRERKPYFVFMTAYSDVDVPTAYNIGADAMFIKPFQTSKAVEFVQYLLGPRLWNWSLPYKGKLPTRKIEMDVPTKNLWEVTPQFNVGNAGLFMSLSVEDLPPARELVAFKINFQSSEPAFQGIGKVRWTRAKSAPGYPTGCGIEILHLIESSRLQIMKCLETHQPISTIPAA